MKKEVLLLTMSVVLFMSLIFLIDGSITGRVVSEERFKVIVTLKSPELSSQSKNLISLPSSSIISGSVVADISEKNKVDLMKLKTAVIQEEVISDVNNVGFFSFSRSDDLIIEKKYEVVPAMVVSVNEDGLNELLANPLVEDVFFDYAFSVDLAESIPQINASSFNTFNISGKGVGVCIIDTGIDDSHSAFNNRIINQKCFCSNNCCSNGLPEADDSDDDSPLSHGTHVSGIVSSNGTFKGVAPSANIISVKVCNAQGVCFSSDILAGIDYCAKNKFDFNISIISGSFGNGLKHTLDNCPTFLNSALDSASALDMFLVFASGNNGYSDGVNYPACYFPAFAVGAVQENDEIASFTNRGDALDLLAPGVNIKSTIIGNNYGVLSGTSQATPHVTGMLALLVEFSEKNNLSNNDIIDSLNQTSVFVQGFPRIDVGRALSYLYSLTNKTSFVPVINKPEITINSPLNNSIVISPVYFNASASDIKEGILNVTWFFWNKTYLNSFELNLSVGNYSANISAVDSDNLTSKKTIFFSVVNKNDSSLKPLVRIISPLDGSFLPKKVDFVAEIFDWVDNNISGTWNSSIEGIIGSGNNISAVLSSGIHNITFTAINYLNHSSFDSIIVNVGSCLIDFDQNLNSEMDIGDVVILFNTFVNDSLSDSSGVFCSQSGTCLFDFDKNSNNVFDIGDLVLIYDSFLNNNLTRKDGTNCFDVI